MYGLAGNVYHDLKFCLCLSEQKLQNVQKITLTTVSNSTPAKLLKNV